MPSQILNDAEGFYRLEISENATTVSLELLKEPVSPAYRNRFLIELGNLGIVEGIDVAAVDQILTHKILNKSIVIARGTEPQPGENGHWELLVDLETKQAPEERLDGSVDFHHVRRFVEVKEGQPLAKHHKPLPGIPGRNCFGKEAPAPAPNDPSWQLGAGARFDPKDPEYVLASRRGVLVKKNGMIHVEDQLKIEGSVDYRTGDIEVSIPVVIAEDIKAGFTVKTKSSITVGGCVQSAHVECGKDLRVQGGVMGEPPSVVRVQGDLKARYLQNSQIEVGGSIAVDKSIVESVVSFGRQMTLGDKLVGGQILGGEKLSLHTAGSELGSASRIFLGLGALERHELFKICVKRSEFQKTHRQNELELIELKQAIHLENMDQRAQKTVSTSSAETDGLREVNFREEELQRELFILTQKEDELVRSLPAEGLKAEFTVRKELFPGTEISIGSQKLFVHAALEGVRTIRQEMLSRAALKILAIGGAEFQKEIRAWSDDLQLWGLKVYDSGSKLSTVAVAMKPDVVLFDGAHMSPQNFEYLLGMPTQPRFSETLFLFFSENVIPELLEKVKVLERTHLVPGLPNPALLGQIGKRLGI